MSEKRCPTESELVSFVDADLPPEQLQRIEKHLELCSRCARRVIDLTTLVADVAAPLPVAEPLDVTAHVSSVMNRLSAPSVAPRASRFLAWAGGLTAAAVLLLFFELRRPGAAEGEAQLTARGHAADETLARNVGVRLYAQHDELEPLESGALITRETRLTAGLRNVGHAPAQLLLFAIDARNTVHWIAPAYESAGSDPPAVSVVPGPGERLLPSAVAFDDLAPGPLRVMTVISREPLHVADVESLPTAELATAALRRRFAAADVREFVFEARVEGNQP